MDQSEAYEPAILTIQTNLLAGLIAIILAAIGSIMVANSIATPINALVKVAKQIAGGNLTLRATVDREDEIGAMAEAFNRLTDQLRSLIRDLEQRVNARTAELERRAVQIKAAGEVARDIAIAEDLNELLYRSVNLIRERFGYYHASIFLSDQHGEYAVLQAATGEAGRLMVEQGHKLKIGEAGIVGNVVASGIPRIASDVGEESLHFKNQLLPETHSEMALPLKVNGEVIGALDVQSQLISAFSKDDIDALQTMADQLAVAIQRAQLVQQLEENIKELQATYQSYTKDAWHEFLRKSRKTYHLNYKQSEIKQVTGQNPETLEALSSNQTVIKKISNIDHPEIGQQTAIAVPIKLRGHVLGALNLQFQSESVNPDWVTLIENISNRLALSLDNARLLMEIRSRAEREHRISEITSKVRATTEIDKILRIAVEELGQVIGVSGAVIQLRTSESREETV
jgi:nitrate/nitrite-specific signal transduction histidine kinase